MQDDLLYGVIAYSIAIFFVIIGILTIAVIFFSEALKKKGIGIPEKMKNILFVKLILEVIAVGFYIFYLGPTPISHDISNVPGHMNNEVYQMYNDAADQLVKGNYQASIDIYSKAIEKDPQNYILYANRSIAYLQMNKTTEVRNDLIQSLDLYSNLSPQQQRRERMYKLLINNFLISAHVSSGDYEEAYTVYSNETGLINDTSDTIMRIYNNIGNAYYEDHKWADAANLYEKTFNLAKSLDNFEMQTRASINISNSKFWIAGYEKEAVSSAETALELIDTFDFGEEMEAELLASSLNALGLAKSLCNEREVGSYSFSEIITDYTNGIEALKQFSERSETEFITLTNLYANRANSYRESGDLVLSVTDYNKACNRYINRRYMNGISRQLVGMYKVLEQKDPIPKNELYALIYFANKIGTNKPAKQKEEDQQLLANAESTLKHHERKEVEQNIYNYLESATEIPGNTWKQF